MYGDGGAPCGDITRLLREIMFRNMRRLRIRFISGSLPFLLSSLMMMPEAERKKTKLSITETKMSVVVVGDPGKSVIIINTAKKVIQKLSVNLSKQA